MSKSDAGKGDDRRPMFITESQMRRNWDKAFGKKKRPTFRGQPIVFVSDLEANAASAASSQRSGPHTPDS